MIIRSLVPSDAWDSVVWASPSSFDPRSTSEVRLQSGSAAVDWLSRRRSLALDSILSTRIADELRVLARARGARAFWIVMHGAMVHVAARLLKDSPLPVHLTVHDDPVGVALMSRRYLYLLPLVLRDFRFAMRRATSVDVVSDEMAKRYRRNFDCDPVVVHRGVESAIAPSDASLDPGVLEIGVLGNSYDYSQLVLLARVVEVAAARVGRSGRIVVVGHGFGERLRKEAGARIEVDVTGHLDEANAVNRLRRSFALYLNYPFSLRTAIFRQTSFPTKLSTYLLAARPILAHSPPDSSIAHMKNLNNFVAWWGDRNIDTGVTALLGLWGDALAHGSQHVIADDLRRRYYGASNNRERLWSTLDAMVTELA